MEDNNFTPNPAGAQSSSQGDTPFAGQGTSQGSRQEGAAGSQSAQQSQELIDELTQLADKFAAVVKGAWNSDQRKQVERDVRTGLTTMAAALEDGFRQVASSNEAKELQTKAGEVGEKVTSTKFFGELTGALTSGLRTLSDQLDKVAGDLQTKNAQPNPPSGSGFTSTGSTGSTSGPSDPAAQDIPISKE